MLRCCLTAALLIVAATPALALNGVCRGFNFQNDLRAVGLYEVAETGRSYFIKGPTREREDCPSLSPACRQRSFLVEGDKVVVNEIEGGFACANYVNRKGTDIASWLPLSSLSRVQVQPRWEGRWTTYDGRAVITVESAPNGRMLVSGAATYDAGGGALNTGQFAVEGDPSKPEFSFGYYGGRQMSYEEAHAGPKRCAARIVQLGPYLAVIDNDACGGQNVRFMGLYARQ
ncbi:hypothetical protein [Methylopila sp. M107]|uniref:hypothetical protein n=1 Tax=Methylopila sp. M107 TaxID=1101190 RepID=UPI0003602B4A|nr:hypothetical protein [Methylopila sp. M107]